MEKKLITTLDSGPKEYELVRPVHTIGRDPQCDISIDHTSLSRQHAKLLVSESTVMVSDMGSRNGTWVDGERVHGEVQLAHGAELKCGQIVFTYTDGAASVPLQGLRAKKDGIRGIMGSDLELSEKFRQSSKMLNYGAFLPTMHWRLRFNSVMVAIVLLAAVGLIFFTRQQAATADETYARQLIANFALENRVVFEQGLPLYSNLSVRDEPAVVESFLLDVDGVPVFPPDRSKEPVKGFGTQPLESLHGIEKIVDGGTWRYMIPIYSGGRPWGYAAMRFDPGKRLRSSYTEVSIIFGALFVSIIGFMAMAWTSRIISRPLKNLDQELELMVSGQINQMSTYGGFPELNNVVKSIYLVIMRMRAQS